MAGNMSQSAAFSGCLPHNTVGLMLETLWCKLMMKTAETAIKTNSSSLLNCVFKANCIKVH